MPVMSRAYRVVDVFTDRPFTGNPAAVVLDAGGLNEAQMSAVAAELNLSETTFVFSLEAERSGVPRFRFRWFTPSVEATMCGHATIAGVHALFEDGRLEFGAGPESGRIDIETRSGPLVAWLESLPASPDRQMIWLELRPPRLEPCPVDRTAMAAALRVSPETFDDLPTVRTQDGDLLVFVRDAALLNDARPDFSALNEWLLRQGLRGLSLATVRTLSPTISVQSRFFAPPVGIDEDPVTGSVHGPLAVYLVRHGLVPVHDGTAGMMCVQGKPGGRTGVVYALVDVGGQTGYRVRIGGHAVTTMRGTLAS
jgi:trans-2,3-dihydro-3-hydroxyanthranilate isomerase